VHSYSYFLRDFPIKQLLGASDMPKLLAAAEAIFTHLKAKLRNLEYPLPRLIDLMQSIPSMRAHSFAPMLIRIIIIWC
jgi:hypothetical protein